jgi:hypothetical protein
MPEFPHGALHEMKQVLIVIDDSYAHFYPIEPPAEGPSTPASNLTSSDAYRLSG